ncbi:hypothetical protein L3X38_032807 [Prunus dulcis]|uniref:Uncharacterized protein n=1 Tax=Prunus dulcis TaxID=3755 RepID=A0AAD4VET3_PRUDU|nr:hypothetical protein L3X38_032807 [Prunus dulcis]
MPSAPPSSFGESAFGTLSSFGESDAFGTPVIIRRKYLRHPAIIRRRAMPSAPPSSFGEVPSAPCHHSARVMPSAPPSSFGESTFGTRSSFGESDTFGISPSFGESKAFGTPSSFCASHAFGTPPSTPHYFEED